MDNQKLINPKVKIYRVALTIDDIKKIVASDEKETIDTELKSFQKFDPFQDKQKRDIAYEIIAFANRNGGKIIFGVKDNGEYDGCKEVNIDDIKQRLHQVCLHSISPVIECSTQFIDEPEGQFLVLYVPRRKGIPHAYVPNRNGSEINSRIYYIRTSHGKKLVSDEQLHWLFSNQQDPGYDYRFRVAFEVDRRLYLVDGIVPLGNYFVGPFRELLNSTDEESIQGKDFTKWMNGLMPFLLLGSLADYFKDSWHIGIHKSFDRMSSGPMNTKPVAGAKLRLIHEIPVTGSTFLYDLNWDFNRILKELFPRPIYIPGTAEIRIEYPNENASRIIIGNTEFELELSVGMLSGGAGLHRKSIRSGIISERYSVEDQQKVLFNFRHFDGEGHLRATFNYPEYDMRSFDEYLNYFQSLKTLLDHYWDFDAARSKYPSKEIFVMDSKLNEILALLKHRKI